MPGACLRFIWLPVVLLFTVAPVVAADVVHVAVASNFITTARKLGQLYEAESGVSVRFSAASTGKLYAQIRNGLPMDVFLAADERRPALLVEEGLAVAGSQWTYAIGELVLWVPGMTGNGEICRQWLSQAGDGRLAMANPRTAPYGAAAQAVLEGLGWYTSLESRLVQGENIGQTFLFVDTGAAAAGFVARGQVLSQAGLRGCQWVPPAHSYPALRQDAVILSRAHEDEIVAALVRWLQSGTAGKAIQAAGYRLP